MKNSKKINENAKTGVVVPVFDVGVPMPPIKVCDEPKAEPQRNDRFREFKKQNGTISKTCIDAKEIKYVELAYYPSSDAYVVYTGGNRVDYTQSFEFQTAAEAEAYYNDLVEWWKYWKQN